MSLWSLIVALEDDDYPAHPQKTVTAAGAATGEVWTRIYHQTIRGLLGMYIIFDPTPVGSSAGRFSI